MPNLIEESRFTLDDTDGYEEKEVQKVSDFKPALKRAMTKKILFE